jgi:hypothetical protein
MGEIWKPAVGYEGYYEVSNMGRVRSLDRVIEQAGRWGLIKRKMRGRERRLKIGLHGYPVVNLSMGGRCTTRRVHRLVLEAFVGPCPDGMECRHLDGIPENNLLGNLRWGTRAENQEDIARHGTLACGERHGGVKLTKWDARFIRIWSSLGYGLRDLAESFGVTSQTISRIRAEKSWA